MELPESTGGSPSSAEFTDTVVRLALAAFLLYLCLRVFAPFMVLMLWALVLAVALYPINCKLAARLGGRQGRAATVFVLSGLILLGVPTAMLASSFAGHAADAYRAFEAGTLTIKPPNEAVAEWPIVGEKLFEAWSAAADNLPKYVHEHEAQLRQAATRLFSAAGNTLLSVLGFLASLIVAGIMMAYGESGARAMQRIFCRLAGPERGLRLHGLSVATIRSVAVGVIGVAFIQALLLGVGFILAGIPAAGLLALIVFLLGIAQLPATLVSLPVIAYLWAAGDASTTMNIVFTVYLVLAGLADNFLKPMLLGRGVDAPMPVILLGALGGMVTGGFMGLFLGAVILAVGYQVFMGWVDVGSSPADDEQPEQAG